MRKKKYKQKVEFLKRFQIVTLLILVLTLALYFYILFKPKITSFIIEDECGPIGGRISHPIGDEGDCENICRAYCLSTGKELYTSSFELKDPQCNFCECFCKEGKDLYK